ncbi:putative N-ethylmaleimide reductase [Aspergillus karnatakaensis]|uniref:alkene reductase n=1 Tax=Aspergillus karnatakaensis TaxID=1810916 RepID=UPI003CCD3449
MGSLEAEPPTTSTESRLFTPLPLGPLTLSHRIILAPLTRYRCSPSHVPLPMMAEYYAQRASTPGTLLIAEATQISPRAGAGGMPNAPALWDEEHIEGWKVVTDKVHARGCFVFCQLIALGRAARVEGLDGGEVCAPSAIPMPRDGTGAEAKRVVPRELTDEEIWGIIEDYGIAAGNAIKAGFDGVEVHGANGYLVDQFLQDVTNQRSDGWGGSVAARSRFAVEVAKRIVSVVGAERVGFRLSPWNTWQGMKMTDPVPQFVEMVRKLRDLGLAYLHLVESRVINNVDTVKVEGLEPFLEAWGTEAPVIVAGGYNAHNTREAVDGGYAKYNVAVAFGRHFLANPDLPLRLQQGLELNKYDRASFYTPRQEAGYTDYPFSNKLTAHVDGH